MADERFIRRVLHYVDGYNDDGRGLSLSPEDKVGMAERLTDALNEGFERPMHSDEHACTVAAFIVGLADDHESQAGGRP